MFRNTIFRKPVISCTEYHGICVKYKGSVYDTQENHEWFREDSEAEILIRLEDTPRRRV